VSERSRRTGSHRPICWRIGGLSSGGVYTLVQLEDAIRQSWGPDTVDPDDGWSADNPARGQCDVTSLVVHDLVGGELMASDVYLDGARIMAHMWNRLPSGIEVDLTREQFRGGEVLGEPTARDRPPASVLGDPAHPRYHRYQAYLVLADRVRTQLGLDEMVDAPGVGVPT